MMHITVEQGHYEEAPEGFTISSGIVGPCIAVGIYDGSNKKGYVIHDEFATIDKIFPEFIEKIKRECNSKNLSAFVTGGGTYTQDTEDEENSVFDNRDYVLDQLRPIVPENKTIIKWLPKDNSVELYLNTTTGKFELE